ncbi:MAG: hypothetical protein LHV68_05240 [Elusimicrobia bacterium]|nr:hypothetical protein [Candidatus Liberimonas magnetica]
MFLNIIKKLRKTILKFKNVKSAFWNKYSEDETDFDNEVRQGIWFRSDDLTPLPEAPEGYYWTLDNGGLSTGRTINYRLWSNKFTEYMVGSE